MSQQFWMPTKQYSLIDAINRGAAATGSIQYAAATSSADYNGHWISMAWNDYRQYWVAEFYWAGRVVIARGTKFQEVLSQAVAEFNRQGKGATLVVETRIPEQEELCRQAGLEPYSKEIEKAYLESWQDWKFAEVGTALWYEQKLGKPATSYLIKATDKDHYNQLLANDGRQI